MSARMSVSLAAAFLCAAAGSLFAYDAPVQFAGRQGIEVASGQPARVGRVVTWAPPEDRAAAWRTFQARTGVPWTSQWDAQTGAAVRAWSEGISVPGSMANPAIAEQFARQFIAEHASFISPNARSEDFVLVADHLEPRAPAMRTVGFLQYHRGRRVLGGQVSFRFKNDRMFMFGAEAWPTVRAAEQVQIGESAAIAAARDWVETDFGAGATVLAAKEIVILPLVRDDRAPEFTLVREVLLENLAVPGRWTVWVDASTGRTVARRQELRFGTGTVVVDVPERWPGGVRVDRPAMHVTATVGGTTSTLSGSGTATWSSASGAQVSLGVKSPYINVSSQAGGQATASFTLADGGSYRWTQAGSETGDAQLTTFTGVQLAKAWARKVSPSMGWLNQSMNATVNVGQNCNAFSNGTDITFYRTGGGCTNTGQLVDVVMHEFGHSYHNHAIIPGAGSWDGALSEGMSDYVAATNVNDPDMGRGFFQTDAPLRRLDDRDRTWQNDQTGEVHDDGEIIGGTYWDVRKNFIGQYGYDEGVRQADLLALAALQRASDIPTTYGEALAADDDDGNLANGTPNKCLIDEAFGRHGLAEGQGGTTPSGPNVGTPVRVDHAVTVSVSGGGGMSVCGGGGGEDPPVATGVLRWRLRDAQTEAGEVIMVAGEGGLSGSLPAVTGVVQYQVDVTAGGTTRSFPVNAADRWYEAYFGDTVVLYCTDFEGAVQPAGWTNGLTSGDAVEGANDWKWGPSLAPAGSGDPLTAHSGSNVMGNDLGGGTWNGKYQASKVNWLASPEIDTQGYAEVRLQYWRWLNVEDGFYDKATIHANTTQVWANRGSSSSAGADVNHTDSEWRFHDVNLSSAVVNGKVKVKYGLASDGGFELGGWTIDDFCVVGVSPAGPDVEVTVRSGSDEDAAAHSTDAGCGVAAGRSGAPCAIFWVGVGIALVSRRRRQR